MTDQTTDNFRRRVTRLEANVTLASLGHDARAESFRGNHYRVVSLSTETQPAVACNGHGRNSRAKLNREGIASLNASIFRQLISSVRCGSASPLSLGYLPLSDFQHALPFDHHTFLPWTGTSMPIELPASEADSFAGTQKRRFVPFKVFQCRRRRNSVTLHQRNQRVAMRGTFKTADLRH